MNEEGPFYCSKNRGQSTLLTVEHLNFLLQIMVAMHVN